MSVKRYNLYFPAGLVVLLGLETSIHFPKWWYIHLIIWALVLLLARLQLGRFKVTAWYRVVGSLIVPGSAMLFFIDIKVWQHIYAVILSLLIAYLFYWLNNYLTNPNDEKTTLLFSLSSIFFTIALALGLHIFFRLSTYYTLGVIFILIAVFPIELILSLRRDSNAANIIAEKVRLKSVVSMWFNQSTKKAFLQQIIKFNWLKKRFWSRIRVSRFKLLLLLLCIELYLIVITLPVNIIVSASLVTVVIYSLVSLLQYAQLNLLKRSLIFRNLGISLFLVLIILITAQWS